MKQFLHRLLYGHHLCPDAKAWQKLEQEACARERALRLDYERERTLRIEAEKQMSQMAKDIVRLSRKLKRAQSDCRKLKEQLEQRQNKH